MFLLKKTMITFLRTLAMGIGLCVLTFTHFSFADTEAMTGSVDIDHTGTDAYVLHITTGDQYTTLSLLWTYRGKTKTFPLQYDDTDTHTLRFTASRGHGSFGHGLNTYILSGQLADGTVRTIEITLRPTDPIPPKRFETRSYDLRNTTQDCADTGATNPSPV